ncbi:MAG: ATP-binding protein, partial [Deltaproteobacteria bacterium]|nr:ATP-binding protein [Deltaproteobacteria bacterium]
MQSNKWSKILEILEKETSQQNFSTWLKPIKFKNIDSTNINIAVNNKFFSDWIRENYKERIERIYETKYGEKKYLVINIEEFKKEITKKNKNNNEIKSKKPIEISVNTFTNINNKYLFNNFVCGPSNQFAHAASLAVANNPATTYNPLFIYGGVGLGKTHLIHAIGNEIIKNNKKFKVSYYSSEKFMNELVNCIRYGKMEEFRTK